MQIWRLVAAAWAALPEASSTHSLSSAACSSAVSAPVACWAIIRRQAATSSAGSGGASGATRRTTACRLRRLEARRVSLAAVVLRVAVVVAVVVAVAVRVAVVVRVATFCVEVVVDEVAVTVALALLCRAAMCVVACAPEPPQAVAIAPASTAAAIRGSGVLRVTGAKSPRTCGRASLRPPGSARSWIAAELLRPRVCVVPGPA